MDRVTISLDEELASDFDSWLAERGYKNRSEAVRDLIREKLGAQALTGGIAKWCTASLTYVYDRTDAVVVQRVIQWQHDHHDLVASSNSVPLDHQDCMETVIARGQASRLQAFAAQLVATRGVRHGNIHLVPLRVTAAHVHRGMERSSHRHLQPIS